MYAALNDLKDKDVIQTAEEKHALDKGLHKLREERNGTEAPAKAVLKQSNPVTLLS